jgi:hypothetical protein
VSCPLLGVLLLIPAAAIILVVLAALFTDVEIEI